MNGDTSQVMTLREVRQRGSVYVTPSGEQEEDKRRTYERVLRMRARGVRVPVEPNSQRQAKRSLMRKRGLSARQFRKLRKGATRKATAAVRELSR